MRHYTRNLAVEKRSGIPLATLAPTSSSAKGIVPKTEVGTILAQMPHDFPGCVAHGNAFMHTSCPPYSKKFNN